MVIQYFYNYIPFKVIIKCWLYSLCSICYILVSYFIHSSLYLLISYPWSVSLREEFKLWLYYLGVVINSGEGNGNPLQYSCLENPVDRGAWWASVHGVAQSRTRLRQFSMYACIGEGNGNPLQCSCLQNPRERGAWWATVYGVIQSWTRLKRLSSSSSSNKFREFRSPVSDFLFLLCQFWYLVFFKELVHFNFRDYYHKLPWYSFIIDFFIIVKNIA